MPSTTRNEQIGAMLLDIVLARALLCVVPVMVLDVLLLSGLNTTVKGCIDEKKSLSETLVAREFERSAALGPPLTGSGALGVVCSY